MFLQQKEIIENIDRKHEIIAESVGFTSEMSNTIWTWLEEKFCADHIPFGDVMPIDLIEKLNDDGIDDLYNYMIVKFPNESALKI